MKTNTVLIAFTAIISFFYYSSSAQVLHSENFNVVIDTSKALKGNFTPSFRFRNVKQNFIEIENISDISVRIKRHAFTVANKIEYSVFGDERLMSGGFAYIEYVNLQSNRIALEPYFQVNWREIRGLDRKYASGLNFRWRPIITKDSGLFFSLGGFYEYERWNYSGVKDELLPSDLSPIIAENIRFNTYISYKQKFGKLFDLDISAYYQPVILLPLTNYRLASSFELTYNVTDNLGFRFLYQNIYDPSPIVPIDKLYNDVNIGITLTF